jgi:hypothetical protein
MKNRYPTAAELYALEREARRVRAECIAHLFRRAVKGLRHA